MNREQLRALRQQVGKINVSTSGERKVLLRVLTLLSNAEATQAERERPHPTGVLTPADEVPVVPDEKLSARASLRRRYRGRSLTDLEVNVLVMLSNGVEAKAIAAHYGKAYDTIKTQLSYIYSKLEARNAPHAVRRAFMLGYLKAES